MTPNGPETCRKTGFRAVFLRGLSLGKRDAGEGAQEQ